MAIIIYLFSMFTIIRNSFISSTVNIIPKSNHNIVEAIRTEAKKTIKNIFHTNKADLYQILTKKTKTL